jgi:hypothetical protein
MAAEIATQVSALALRGPKKKRLQQMSPLRCTRNIPVAGDVLTGVDYFSTLGINQASHFSLQAHSHQSLLSY